MAADKKEIDLIVNALTKGFDKMVKDIERVGEETEKTEKKNKKSKSSWTELASALSIAQQAFQVVAGAAKFAYDNIKEGAELNLAADRFDNLTASIGTTSASMLTDLRAATKGMQSDAELIAGATDIISLGLADTQEGTVRLATAVSTLGLDMQQVILTFANNSKARLDALGLSIEDVDAKTRELEANGFKGDAFDEAVLIALEDKMTLLGDASETTAGQLQILESNWKNISDRWKQDAAEAAGPIVSSLVKLGQESEKVNQAYERGLITFAQRSAALNQLKTGETSAAEQLARWNIVLDENGKIIGQITEDGIKYTAMMEKQTGAVEEATEAYVQQDAKLRAVNAALLDFSGDLGPTTQELEALAAAIERVKAEEEARLAGIEATIQAEEEAAAAAKEHAASMGDLFAAAIESKDAIGFYNETAAEMSDRTFYNSNLTRDQRDALSDLQAEYEKAQGIINDYTIGAKGVGMETEAVNEKVAEQQQRMIELQAAMEPLLAVGGEYVDVQGTMTINQDALNKSIFDAADAQGASAEQLAILGGALGLYSDEAVEAALKTALIQAKIDELTAAWLENGGSVDSLRGEIMDFVASLDETSGSAETLTGSTSDLGDELGNARDKAIATAEALNLIPSNIPVHISVTSDPIPSIPGGPAEKGPGGTQAEAYASGTGGWVTVPGPVGMAVPIIVHGGEEMNIVPVGQGRGGQGGGGVTQNNYFANPTNPNAIATATAEKLGQLK